MLPLVIAWLLSKSCTRLLYASNRFSEQNLCSERSKKNDKEKKQENKMKGRKCEPYFVIEKKIVNYENGIN